MVVQELNPDLVVPVALYYLVLRGLDTIEDDMTISLEQKEPLLRNFKMVLDKDGWAFDKSGPNEKDRELLVHFDDVITELKLIDPEYRDIIKDITHQMGNGMADYARMSQNDVNSVKTVEEYELYCHYVAGLVGDGLTRFFVQDGFANPSLKNQPELSEAMGQFLQKTNVIRDVREDFDDKRRFWPKEIWSKHVDKFDDLFDPKHREAALTCSSEMVLNALRHAEECLAYMEGIKGQGVFNFVAIPQTMAIATLELVFQNPKVFKTNIEITKGDAAQLLIDSSQDLRKVCAVFKRYIGRICKKNNPKDPNFLNISVTCAKIEQYIESIYSSKNPRAGIQLADDRVVVANKSGAIGDEPKIDIPYLILSMLGTLFVISAIMIGIAYSAGARFDVVLKELANGNIFPGKEIFINL
ncbi:farnesyl-diphosphate farnesyltransferase [Pseudogymnoascus sp. 23342-1-I1]|nr:farnesyl-diphosphate farnesyltransferase [Pseudogymnoascus sp. 23342-1-I1]